MGRERQHHPIQPPQPSPAADRELLPPRFWGVSFAFPKDFSPDFPAAPPRSPRLTCTGEVPALDGVARAGVHPAGGFGVVAVKDKDKDKRGCQDPGGVQKPLPLHRHHGDTSPAKRGDSREEGTPKKGEISTTGEVSMPWDRGLRNPFPSLVTRGNVSSQTRSS